eukprot:12011_1
MVREMNRGFAGKVASKGSSKKWKFEELEPPDDVTKPQDESSVCIQPDFSGWTAEGIGRVS